MSGSPEDSLEKRLQDIVDGAANAPEEASEELADVLRKIGERVRLLAQKDLTEPGERVAEDMVGGLGDVTSPGRHVIPTLKQEARAIDALQSDWLSELVELDEEDRSLKIGEMAVDAAAQGDKAELSLLRTLLNGDEVDWSYIGQAIDEGPEARIWDTTHWLIANGIARLEQPPTA